MSQTNPQMAMMVGANGTTVRPLGQQPPYSGGGATVGRYCYICQAPGHQPRDCPLRKERQAGGDGGVVAGGNAAQMQPPGPRGAAAGSLVPPPMSVQLQQQHHQGPPPQNSQHQNQVNRHYNPQRNNTHHNTGGFGGIANAHPPGPGQPCFNCNQTGHFIRDCPNPPNEKNGTICFKCQKPGHFAKDCKEEDAKPPGGHKHLPCLVCKEFGHFAVNCPRGKQPQGMAAGFGDSARAFTDGEKDAQDNTVVELVAASSVPLGRTTSSIHADPSMTLPKAPSSGSLQVSPHHNVLDSASNHSADGHGSSTTIGVAEPPSYAGSAGKHNNNATTKHSTNNSSIPSTYTAATNTVASEYDSSNLIVNYIPNEITNALQLQDLFREFGEIDNVKLPRRPWPAGQRGPMTAEAEKAAQQHRGYGFVKFRRVADAERAIREMDGLAVGNKFIRVSVAAGSKERLAREMDDGKDGAGGAGPGGVPPPPPFSASTTAPAAGQHRPVSVGLHQQQLPPGAQIVMTTPGQAQTQQGGGSGAPEQRIVQQVMIPGENGRPGQIITLPAGTTQVMQQPQQKVVMVDANGVILGEMPNPPGPVAPPQIQLVQQQQAARVASSVEEQQQQDLRQLLGNLSFEDDGDDTPPSNGLGNTSGDLPIPQPTSQFGAVPSGVAQEFAVACHAALRNFRAPGIPTTAAVIVPRAQLVEAISLAVMDIHLRIAVESGHLAENNNGTFVVMPEQQ